MNIKNAAYEFQKKVWYSPNREEVYHVVSKLKSSSRGIGNKIYPSPILGLLLYDQQSLKRVLGKSPIEELSSWHERELGILFGAHEQMCHFNEQCLAPLGAKLPQTINAINPYKEYSHHISTHGFEELFFSQSDAEEIIQKFHTHPAFDVAISNIPSVNEQSIGYDQTISNLTREIIEAGAGANPRWVEDYEIAKMREHPHLGDFLHVGALLSLHNSLANLNQLIYQGLFQNELIQMNRGHVIDYLWTQKGAGPSMWLMHIPYGDMYIFEVTDLIVVNLDKTGAKGELGDRLCCIHSKISPGSRVSPGILEMRMIDENLNAYSRLIR